MSCLQSLEGKEDRPINNRSQCSAVRVQYKLKTSKPRYWNEKYFEVLTLMVNRLI